MNTDNSEHYFFYSNVFKISIANSNVCGVKPSYKRHERPIVPIQRSIGFAYASNRSDNRYSSFRCGYPKDKVYIT